MKWFRKKTPPPIEPLKLGHVTLFDQEGNTLQSEMLSVYLFPGDSIEIIWKIKAI